jgi:hypothetical protein
MSDENDLDRIPDFLDRTAGMTPEQIRASGRQAIRNAGRARKPGKPQPAARPSNLTERDKEVIAALKKAGADKVSAVKQIGAKLKSEVEKPPAKSNKKTIIHPAITASVQALAATGLDQPPEAPATPAAQPQESDVATKAKNVKTDKKIISRPKTATKPAKAKSVKASAANGERKNYDWKGHEERAKTGIMPPAPDFSADTHTRYRPALAEVVSMAKDKNIPGLKKFKWDGFAGSSVKSVLRYRDLCMVALTEKHSAD